MSRRRHRRWVPILALAALTGCAQPVEPAADAALAAAAAAWHVAPEHVLTTSVDGFEPAPQSAGVYGSDGFSLAFADASAGRLLMLTAVGGHVSEADCPEVPVVTTTGAAADGAVECTADGELFFRSAGETLEYALERDGVLVRVSGTGVGRDVLRSAAEHVRVPSADELAVLRPPAPDDVPTPPGDAPALPGDAPVEREDLPPGDGAPDNSVGTGG